MEDARKRLGLQCPPTSAFYICSETPKRFVGCCSVDACQRGGDCPLAKVESATFNASRYEDIPPQECDSSTALWWTCKFTKPPFFGCCSQNPCTQTSGCPSGSLGVAVLNRDPSLAASLLPMSVSTTTTTTTTTTSSTAVTSTRTESSTGSPPTTSSSSTTRAGGTTISGGVAAGIGVGVSVAVIGLLAALLFCLWRRAGRKKQEKANDNNSPQQQNFHSPAVVQEMSASTSPAGSPARLHHQVSPWSGYTTSPSPQFGSMQRVPASSSVGPKPATPVSEMDATCRSRYRAEPVELEDPRTWAATRG
ncbi:hypothetical protein XA68_17290 [Ophiocordyceps unilateralis]|uniref:Mid2 domain-containing protein n=1 Tax=Ophiocordyceps unilateralis TaxID=268505 RepID=A0A2A9PR01_OPHUN|nr:hypothetical protein XA68_17290 [Ophiocordyceps unilateralis]